MDWDAMNDRISSIDCAEWPSSRQSSLCSLTTDSESSGLLLNAFPSPPTPRFSAPPSSNESEFLKSISDHVRLDLHPAVTVSFAKGSRLFKLKFSHINVCKDPTGGLRCIEMGEEPGSTGAFVHAFPNTRLPVPHIEQPIVSNKAPAYVVSFLDEQTVQTSGTLFATQPHYAFDDREDWIRFQETLLNQHLVFVAGIAEAKSKGRGEECISQNLRIFKTKTGKQSIVLFANSQRKRENKRYISIPLDGVDQIEQPKKASKPITLKLRPNNELLGQLKSLQILFLDENGELHRTSFSSRLSGSPGFFP
jgi:hypothetical protein